MKPPRGCEGRTDNRKSGKKLGPEQRLRQLIEKKTLGVGFTDPTCPGNDQHLADYPDSRDVENSHLRWLGAVHLLGQPLRGSVAPGGDQRFANRALPGGPQSDIRRTTASPAALDRCEGRGLASDEQLLLLGGELDHAPAAAGIAQRREDPAGHAKVRVTHVRGFSGLRQTQRDASELSGGHGIAPPTMAQTPWLLRPGLFTNAIYPPVRGRMFASTRGGRHGPNARRKRQKRPALGGGAPRPRGNP